MNQSLTLAIKLTVWKIYTVYIHHIFSLCFTSACKACGIIHYLPVGMFHALLELRVENERGELGGRGGGAGGGAGRAAGNEPGRRDG